VKFQGSLRDLAGQLSSRRLQFQGSGKVG